MASLICAIICLGHIPDRPVVGISLTSQFTGRVVILKSLYTMNPLNFHDSNSQTGLVPQREILIGLSLCFDFPYSSKNK